MFMSSIGASCNNLLGFTGARGGLQGSSKEDSQKFPYVMLTCMKYYLDLPNVHTFSVFPPVVRS